MNYIGITENRMKHIVKVAETCYTLAKEKYGWSEEQARMAYLTGYLHDVGYSFSVEAKNHSQFGGCMIAKGFQTLDTENDILYAVKNHGNPEAYLTPLLIILNEADLTVNSKGEQVSIEERLKDIEERYGKDTEYYKKPAQVAKLLSECTERVMKLDK